MREIPLTRDKVALVDDEDFSKVAKYRWHALKSPKTWYATANIPGSNPRKKISMHRLILGLANPKDITDHKDHNGLNNQKANLRICTNAENRRNILKDITTKRSIYKGVSYGSRNRIRATIRHNKIKHHLGYFKTEEAAALAYNEAAKYYFKDFAHLNVLTKPPQVAIV